MIGFLTVIHVIICIFLVISILLQSSKGGGLAGMFGGGGAMSGVFGGRGAASFLSKVTLWLAIGFATTTLSIALLSAGLSGRSKSLIEKQMEIEQTASPAAILPTVQDEEEPALIEDIPENPE